MKHVQPCGVDTEQEECPLLLAVCLPECACVGKPAPGFGNAYDIMTPCRDCDGESCLTCNEGNEWHKEEE